MQLTALANHNCLAPITCYHTSQSHVTTLANHDGLVHTCLALITMVWRILEPDVHACFIRPDRGVVRARPPRQALLRLRPGQQHNRTPPLRGKGRCDRSSAAPVHFYIIGAPATRSPITFLYNRCAQLATHSPITLLHYSISGTRLSSCFLCLRCARSC